VRQCDPALLSCLLRSPEEEKGKRVKEQGALGPRKAEAQVAATVVGADAAATRRAAAAGRCRTSCRRV